jgi:hypothetical protein
MFRILSLLLIVALAVSAQAPLEVVAAYYGADRHFFDVTDAVKAQAQADGLNLTVGAEALGGDPMPGVGKTLRVYFKWTGRFDVNEAKDGEMLRIGRATSTASSRGPARETIAGRGGAPVLTITGATYGANGRTLDATSLLQSRVQDNRLDFEVGAANLADPAPGVVKELAVTYLWQGQTREARVRDGERLILPPAAVAEPMGPSLRLLSATYGAGSRSSDVLGLLLTRLANDRLLVSADNTTLGGDPARGANKVLNVTYEYRGQRYTASAKEGQILRLPPDNLPAPAAPALPADGACFYPAPDYQGTPTCVSQDQSRLSGAFGSVRLLGRIRSLDLFENNGYGGRTVRLSGDQADLSQVSAGGGFFSNTTQYQWAGRPGSVRLLAQ